MISNVNFTGLHVKPSPENTKALSKILNNDTVISAAKKSFNQINTKSGSHDVYLKTIYNQGKDDVTHRDDNYFEMQIVDKNENVLSAARFSDSDNQSDTFRSNCKRQFERLAELFEPPSPVASEAAQEIFDTFA